MSLRDEAHDAWVKDGTKDEAPVTESTPAIETATAPVATDTPQSAQDSTTVSTADTNSDSATSDDAGSAAPVTEAPSPSVPEIEYIEGKIGDQTFKVPKNLTVPVKRGNETAFVPVTEVLSSTMMERDYRQKTAKLAEERRAFLAEQARLEAQRKADAEERQQYEDAMRTPEGQLAYAQHLEMMQTNPVYKRNWEAAQLQRETEAELDVYRAEQERALIEEATANLQTTILDLAKEYPGVDSKRVIAEYAQALTAGTVKEITLDSIHQFYKQEADTRTTYVAPLQSELSTLKSENEKLAQRLAALEHNAKTDKALADKKTVNTPVITGTAKPISPSRPAVEATPFTSEQYAERRRQWAAAG